MDEYMQYMIFEGDLDLDEPLEDEDGGMSPVNIRTALYGLFLIAKDNTTDTRSLNTIKKATEMIYDISDEEISHAFSDVFPPDDLSIENLINIAKNIKSLHKVLSECKLNHSVEQFDRKYKRVIRAIDKVFLNGVVEK